MTTIVRTPRVEIAVQDSAGARLAVQRGADQLELCSALVTGGMTPSIALTEMVVAAAGSAPVRPLIRPRPGDFVYTAEEIECVSRDIRAAIAAGSEGVVVGALTPEGAVDTEAMKQWIDAAGDAGVTYHRALDVVVDTEAAIALLIELGVDRVLTSGQATAAGEGLAQLAEFVRWAEGRLEIMAGGGVTVASIADLRSVGVDAVHLSARAVTDRGYPSGPGGGVSSFDVTDGDLVAAAVAAARS